MTDKMPLTLQSAQAYLAKQFGQLLIF